MCLPGPAHHLHLHLLPSRSAPAPAPAAQLAPGPRRRAPPGRLPRTPADVVDASPDYKVYATVLPNDPYVPLTYASGSTTYQWYLHKVSAPAAWDLITGSPQASRRACRRYSAGT